MARPREGFGCLLEFRGIVHLSEVTAGGIFFKRNNPARFFQQEDCRWLLIVRCGLFIIH